MKRLAIFVAVLLAVAPQVADARGKTIDAAQAEMRSDGLTYKVGADNPFTGVIREMRDRKQKRSEFNYVDGKRHGLSMRWWPNGELQFSGGFENGRPTGGRTDYHANGTEKRESILVDGKLNGDLTTWFENGNKQKSAVMVDGKEHGLVITWRDDGTKRSEENFVNGQNEFSGVSNHWGGDGNPYQLGRYESGKFTGKKLMWTRSGLAGEEVFVDGERVENAEILGQAYANGQIWGERRWINGDRQETRWFENGQVEELRTVHPHLEDGRWQVWYENGQPKKDYRAAYDIKEGPDTSWYANGQKKSVRNFLHGKKHGVQTEWHEDGRIKSESRYAYGRLLNEDGTPMQPLPPKNSLLATTSADVTYAVQPGSLRIWNTRIESVSDGSIDGNTAVVAPGATLRLTGNWQFGQKEDPRPWAGSNLQVYASWVPDAVDRGAWMPSEPLWAGQRHFAHSDPAPSGTFDWTTQAPIEPGTYYIGRGETRAFYKLRQTEGRLGRPTGEEKGETTASFQIEVRLGLEE